MMPTYAQPADLAVAPWSLVISEEAATELLRHASRLVRRATVTAIYDADAGTGLPTKTSLRDALRDAACAQVVVWSRLAIDPVQGAVGAASKIISAKSLGSGSIQYSVYAATVEARARTAVVLCDDALAILEDAGLTGSEPLVFG